MEKRSFKPASYPGTLHHYKPRLTAFEHQCLSSPTPTQKGALHTILFLGGLGDGLLHPTYPSAIARHLPPSWSIVEVLLSSSYSGWTTSSLVRDATELARAVQYFRSLPFRATEDGAKIVLMGHSTGSQVCMEYVVGPWKVNPLPAATLDRPKIDGIILQAGISDREGLTMALSSDEMAGGVAMAKMWAEEGRGKEILPRTATKGVFGPNPSAERWMSLAGVDGDDDYFSSDLRDSIIQRTFGKVGERGIPMCILLSGEDEHMPAFVDKQQLLERWVHAVRQAGGVVGGESGVIEGAKHNLNESSEEIRGELCKRVRAFVGKLEAGELVRPAAQAEKL